MQPIDMVDETAPAQEPFPVSVLLERRPATVSPWIDHLWSAVGVVVGTVGGGGAEPRLVHDADGVQQFLFGGLRVALYADECESYYHNMMSPLPRCYVIAHLDEQDCEGRPEPFLVSMSFDEAHAYLEGGDEIYEVDIPPELYAWTEAFVLAYYAPERRRKRKLRAWKDEAAGPRPS